MNTKNTQEKDQQQPLEEIAGQCENCGTEYRFRVRLDGSPIHCPSCKKETQNFDTTTGSLFAPSIVEIIKG